MRKISSTEFALAAALFVVSGMTALAETYIGPSAPAGQTAIARATQPAEPARALLGSAR